MVYGALTASVSTLLQTKTRKIPFFQNCIYYHTNRRTLRLSNYRIILHTTLHTDFWQIQIPSGIRRDVTFSSVPSDFLYEDNMKRQFQLEWNRMLHSRSFLFSVICAALFVIADTAYHFVNYLNGIDVETSVFYKWLGVNSSLFAGPVFYLALPLLTAFAYSWSVAYDRKSGYLVQILARTSRKNYFIAKYLVSFISGGMIFAGALVLNYMLLALFSPAYRPFPADLATSAGTFSFLGDLFYTNTYCFSLLWCLTAFLWGGAMVSICTAASMFIRKPAVACLMPFLVFEAEQLIGSYVMQKAPILIRDNMLELVWTNMLYAAPESINPTGFVLCNIAVVILLPTLVYMVRSRKYECL